MACVGIDVGFANAVVAIARRGGIDVLDNEVSKKLTASMVGFSGKERKMGEGALSGITSNMKNTITGIKAIIGKKFHSEEIQNELPRVAYTMTDVAGSVGIPVQYNEEEVVISTERAMSMLLSCMRQIAQREQAAGVEVKDVVLSVPAYFTDAERRAMLDAASIIGLNVLRLMTDVTAAALAYGIFKTDMPADKTTNVAFVDMGALDTTCSVVGFVKGKLTVLSTASDRHLGGRDFDTVLADYFAAEWKEKHKIDAKTNKKAMFRLMTAAEKTKKVLSSNPKAPIAIECFMNDIDVKGMMERADFLEMCAPLMVKLEKVLEEAFASSGLAKADIESVEIIGGSVRIPCVQETISKFFGKECKKTQNFDECIAKGCALQCAMLSPAFRVREFAVNDVAMYPIALSWSPTSGGMEVDAEADAETQPKAGATSTVVFSRFNPVPNTKMLTFYRKDTFSLRAEYDSSVVLPGGFPFLLNEFTVADIPIRTSADGKPESARIKVKLRLDIHGCLQCESAQAIEEQEVVEEVAAASTPEATATPEAAAPEAAAEAAEGVAAEAPAAADGDTPMPDAEAKPVAEGAEAASAEAATEPEKKKKKTKKISLTISEKPVGMSARDKMEAQEAEGKMAIQDRIMRETADAMNNLESRIYAMRDDLSMRYSKYVAEAEKERLQAMLTQVEDWLYEDGADADKATYEAKLKEVMTACGPVLTREREATSREGEISSLQSAIDMYAAFAVSAEEQYAHIEASDKAKVGAEAESARAYLTEMTGKLQGLAPTADPPFLVSELTAKLNSLKDVCDPIMKKPKPPPPPPPAAPAAAAEADAESAAPATATAEAESAQNPPQPDNMDIDID
jgi:heat shock protein 4